MAEPITYLVAAQAAFANEGHAKDIAFRKAQLHILRKILTENEDRLYEAIYKDFRKSRFDTFLTELSQVYSELSVALKNLEKWSRPKRVAQGIANFPGNSKVIPEPLGHTLIIGAWNYPYNLTLVPVISAIAAGNTCIIKPSELTANCSRIMAEIINAAFEPGFIHVVEGGPDVANELLKHKYDKIFFTGSTAVGKIVAKAAAEHLTPVTLELGGKSPCFVFEDADLKMSAKRIAWGKFINSGQTCVAPDFVLVQESIYEAFLKELKSQIQLVCGENPKESESYCRIVNSKHYERLTTLMNHSKVIFGGERDQSLNYISPTLVGEVKFNDEIMQEEIFGPVLPIIKFNNLQSILHEIKSRPKPLALYLFTREKKIQRNLISALSFGGGAINDTVMHLANHRLPFGGVGASGTGSYHGEAGFNTFSHFKSILYRPFWFETNLKYRPYSALKSWLIKVFIN